MKLTRPFGLLPLLGGLLLAACQDDGPTVPLAHDSNLSTEDAMAVDLLSFDAATDVALALADVPVAAMMHRGMGRGASAASGSLLEARQRYQQARRLMEDRDSAGAALQAGEARRLIARAGQTGMGGRFAAGMVERLEELALMVGRNPGAFHDPLGLQGELNGLATRARDRLHHGDSIGAAQCGILGEQRYRQRQRDNGLGEVAVDVHVALAAEGVALAAGILQEQGADEGQLTYLAAAEEYLATARAAVEAGDVAAAIRAADLAVWTSLKSVVLPGGVTDDEVRAVADLAEVVYAEAAATELDEAETLLLARAQDLIDHGTTVLEAGSVRGIGAFWRAAVICSWLAG